MVVALLLGWLVSGAVLYAFLRRKERRSDRLLWAVMIGGGAGIGRALLASVGCLLIGSTGWFQVPAYFLIVLFALPEMVLFPMNFMVPGMSLADGGWWILARLAGTIVASSMGLAMVAALLAEASSRTSDHSPPRIAD